MEEYQERVILEKEELDKKLELLHKFVLTEDMKSTEEFNTIPEHEKYLL